jgi:hypothetical protein
MVIEPLEEPDELNEVLLSEPGQETNYENAIAIGCCDAIRDGGHGIRAK